MIKKILMSFMLIFSMMAAPSVSLFSEQTVEAATAPLIVNSKNGIVIRDKANSNGKKLITVSYGYIVQNLGTTGKWVKVRFGKTTGYTQKANLKTPSAKQGKMKKGGKITVKNNPSKNGTAVGTISGGATVSVYGTSSTWAYVMTKSVQGYVDRSQVELAKAQITIADGYYPNKNKKYIYMGSEIGDYFVGVHAGNNEWSTDDGGFFDPFPHVEVKGNTVTYSYIDASDVYQFPMYKGKKWTYKDIYSTKNYEVISISEKITLTDKRVDYKETFTNVLVVKETVNSGGYKMVGYTYFAKGIGPIYSEFMGNRQYSFVGFKK